MTRWLRRSLPVLGVALLGGAALAQSPGSVQFAWAVAVLSNQDGREVLAPLTGRAVLRGGDRLKLMLRLTQPGFPYVVLRQESGSATLLYPATVPSKAPHQVESDVFIPAGIDWFHVGRQPSADTLYVIVSAERLSGLETLFAGGRQVPGDPVMSELNLVRSRMGTLRSPAERPADIGGRRRATDYETRIADMAIESSGDRLVVKTFLLERR